jgi:signal transduction histidine kinase/CheY-like chemotaxis protein
MPGYRLKAAVDCARIAWMLEQPELSLQLVELGRSIRLDDLPIHWATELEDIAALVHESRGDLQQAMLAERRARALERRQTRTSIQSTTGALLECATKHSEYLRAFELEQVNDALRATTRRMEAALDAADSARHRAEVAAGGRHLFLSRMSHELRTPLQGVLGAIELFHDTPLTRDQRELLGMLDRSARITLEIINDILDVARLEEGHLELEHKPFMLQSVLDDTISQVRTRAVEQDTTIHVTVDPTLPRLFLGDRRRLTQIMLNLTSNAVKFTTNGTVNLTVRPSGRSVAFIVQDTGCGIAAADLETIFEPYIRAPSGQTPETEGSGLGLAIAHRLVTAMNGSINATSQPDVGSTFTVTLDLPAAAPSTDTRNRSKRTVEGPNLSGVRVLLAEDNSVSQMVLQRHIRMLGAQVEVVDTGPDALTRVLESTFDVVILDFHMPGLSGLEVSRQLRRAGYNLPIIGLTASALPEDEAAARAAHMDAYATKPISRRQLQRLVHGTVEARRT